MKSAISIAPRTWRARVSNHILFFFFYLPPYSGDPVLVAEKSVHVDTVLDDEGCDWNQGKDLQQNLPLRIHP